jgi:hypothetical protein
MICNDFSSVSGFFASVSDAYFECFICLQMCAANVLSRCLKSRSGVASSSSPSVASPQLDVSSSWRRLGIRCRLPLFSMLVTFVWRGPRMGA